MRESPALDIIKLLRQKGADVGYHDPYDELELPKLRMLGEEEKMSKIMMFSISHYVQAALKRACYEVDENDVIIAYVPSASGFFSQGETFEEARENLRDAIEGNVVLALQLGLPIPPMEDVVIEVQDAPAHAT